MSSLIVCNTGSDSISKVSIDEDFGEEELATKEILLKNEDKPLGPSSICLANNIAYTANSYSNSISIINMDTLKEENSIYVGAHPNDLAIDKNYLYIACSESNSVVIYDIKEKKIVLDITVNSWPHNIELCKSLNLLFISNFQSNNVSIIDITTNKVINELTTLEYPTKIKVSNDKKLLYVCESYMGDDKNGYIEVFDIKTFESINRIKVGKSPVDILEDEGSIYICNFGDGTLTIIDRSNYKKFRKMSLGGMPKSIIKLGEIAFVSDYLNGRIICINLNINKTKVITVGKEPNAMTLY
ncbi:MULTISPECIES: beta-propeller fold lactonase family protein [unclassified Clostridium]|uniref:YncE family protein n=1 Tax=unclassified Clostridium TaxID=2614128 RepID=UPI00189BA0B7|nr:MULTISPECIES: beta-propeller fold lactonase family protein [unclassified Clostridium]MCR1949662.1 YncE family protein [Clostridium sp. DSM 100503]